MNIIYGRHGCTKLRILLPAMIQIPLFIVVSIALRSMCGWGAWFDIGLGVPMDPLLQNEGFGTIKNLVQTDGSFTLPVMIGLLSITNLEASVSLSKLNKALILLLVDSGEESGHLQCSTNAPYPENHESISPHGFCSHDSARYASACCKLPTLRTNC